MILRSFRHVLSRFGEKVLVCRKEEEEGVCAKAFLRPILGRNLHKPDVEFTKDGMESTQKYLYLGEPGVPLDDMKYGCVLWNGQSFSVEKARLVSFRDSSLYWFAVLLPNGETAGCPEPDETPLLEQEMEEEDAQASGCGNVLSWGAG